MREYTDLTQLLSQGVNFLSLLFYLVCKQKQPSSSALLRGSTVSAGHRPHPHPFSHRGGKRPFWGVSQSSQEEEGETRRLLVTVLSCNHSITPFYVLFYCP